MKRFENSGMKRLPKVTFGLLSFNRLQYLKATLLSARECIKYPNMEWIVSDNCSQEPGLQDFLDNQTWLDLCIRKEQTHAEAMNELVEKATGKYIFIWPEDVQFVVKGEWLVDLIEILEKHPEVGSVSLNAIRKCTLQEYFSPGAKSRVHWLKNDLAHFKKLRKQKVITSSRGLQLFTLGGATPGVSGAGIPTLTRMAIWKELGPWKFKKQGASIIDSSLGAEDDMVMRFFDHGRPWQMGSLQHPVAADILTDPTGCKAKVRGNYRFGVYMPAPVPPFYYEIREQEQFQSVPGQLPLSFFEVAKPVGFDIPKDSNGDHVKSALNVSVVYDINKQCQVDFPLMHDDVVSRL